MGKKIGVFGAGAHEVACALIGNVGDHYAFVAFDARKPAEPALRGDQPSPTGDDGDKGLQMKPVQRPRMIGGSASKGWTGFGVDVRKERE